MTDPLVVGHFTAITANPTVWTGGPLEYPPACSPANKGILDLAAAARDQERKRCAEIVRRALAVDADPSWILNQIENPAE